MNRGGKRKGAGRPPLPEALKKQPCPIKLEQWIIDDIDSRPGSRAATLREAYIKVHKLKKPKKITV